jgi:hypothetical protein
MSKDGTVQVLIAFITGVLGPILLQYVKTALEKKETKKDPLIEDIEYDALVTEQLDILLDELDLDRAWITQFHNGGHFNYSGKSMSKFTMFYESVAPGISKILSQFQNVPTSMFAKSLNEVMKSGELMVEDFSDENTMTYGLKDIADSTGCKSIYLVGLKCPTNNKILGLLGVEFVKETHSYGPEEKARIKEIGAFLAGVLTQQQNR